MTESFAWRLPSKAHRRWRRDQTEPIAAWPILSRGLVQTQYAKLSEKLRGAGGDRHGGQHNGNREAEGQRGDQRGQGAAVVRRARVARRHREAKFGRSSKHGRSFGIQPSTVPFPAHGYGCKQWRSCWKIKANPGIMGNEWLTMAADTHLGQTEKKKAEEGT